MMSLPSSGTTPAETAGQGGLAHLDFRPRPSRILGRFLIITHALAGLVVVLFAPDKWWMASLLLLVGASYFLGYRRHVLQLGSTVARRVVCRGDGSWYLQDNAGDLCLARILPSSYLHPKLVILNFRLAQQTGRRNLVLCPDSLDVQTLRRLRQHLRVAALRQSSDARFPRAG